MFHRPPEELDDLALDFWRDEPHTEGQTHAIVTWLPKRIPVSLLLRAAPVSTAEPGHLGWMQVAGVAIGVQADPALAGSTKILGEQFGVHDVMSWPVLPIVPATTADGVPNVEGYLEASRHGAYLTWEPDDLAAVLGSLPEWAERSRQMLEGLRRMVRAADLAIGPQGVRPEPGDLPIRLQVLYVAAIYDAAYTFGLGNAREYAARILQQPGYIINRRCAAAAKEGLLIKDARGRYVPPYATTGGTEHE